MGPDLSGFQDVLSSWAAAAALPPPAATKRAGAAQLSQHTQPQPPPQPASSSLSDEDAAAQLDARQSSSESGVADWLASTELPQNAIATVATSIAASSAPAAAPAAAAPADLLTKISVAERAAAGQALGGCPASKSSLVLPQPFAAAADTPSWLAGSDTSGDDAEAVRLCSAPEASWPLAVLGSMMLHEHPLVFVKMEQSMTAECCPVSEQEAPQTPSQRSHSQPPPGSLLPVSSSEAAASTDSYGVAGCGDTSTTTLSPASSAGPMSATMLAPLATDSASAKSAGASGDAAPFVRFSAPVASASHSSVATVSAPLPSPSAGFPGFALQPAGLGAELRTRSEPALSRPAVCGEVSPARPASALPLAASSAASVAAGQQQQQSAVAHRQTDSLASDVSRITLADGVSAAAAAVAGASASSQAAASSSTLPPVGESAAALSEGEDREASVRGGVINAPAAPETAAAEPAAVGPAQPAGDSQSSAVVAEQREPPNQHLQGLPVFESLLPPPLPGEDYQRF